MSPVSSRKIGFYGQQGRGFPPVPQMRLKSVYAVPAMCTSRGS